MLAPINRFYRWVLDLVFPPRCEVCRRVGNWLCPTCAGQLQLLEGPLCLRCGRIWSGSGPCRSCCTAPLKIQILRSAFLFEGPIRGAVHALKYRGGVQVVEVLGPALAQAWNHYHLESDLLVPVPLHIGREAQRGYNQAYQIAAVLGQYVGIPVAERALQRVLNTTSQTKLNREARRSNVAEAFAPGSGLAVTQKRVTLVDDVATTGATLDACAAVLLAHGALQVNAFTLARAS